jgi:AcrR family transcriptional regulator
MMNYDFYHLSQVESPHRMNGRAKMKPDDTREQIMDAADALFRRIGFTKTTVADIAAELGMSSGNVYRFFPAKQSIVEAICERCLGTLEAKAWTIARSRGSAGRRLERLFVEIATFNKENLLHEQRVHEIVLVAIESSWDAIRAHKEVLRNVVELLVRDGVDTGEFEALEPRETAALIMRSMVSFIHPVLIGQCLEDHRDLEAAVCASLAFLLRPILARSQPVDDASCLRPNPDGR